MKKKIIEKSMNFIITNIESDKRHFQLVLKLTKHFNNYSERYRNEVSSFIYNIRTSLAGIYVKTINKSEKDLKVLLIVVIPEVQNMFHKLNNKVITKVEDVLMGAPYEVQTVKALKDELKRRGFNPKDYKTLTDKDDLIELLEADDAKSKKKSKKKKSSKKETKKSKKSKKKEVEEDEEDELEDEDEELEDEEEDEEDGDDEEDEEDDDEEDEDEEEHEEESKYVGMKKKELVKLVDKLGFESKGMTVDELINLLETWDSLKGETNKVLKSKLKAGGVSYKGMTKDELVFAVMTELDDEEDEDEEDIDDEESDDEEEETKKKKKSKKSKGSGSSGRKKAEPLSPKKEKKVKKAIKEYEAMSLKELKKVVKTMKLDLSERQMKAERRLVRNIVSAEFDITIGQVKELMG